MKPPVDLVERARRAQFSADAARDAYGRDSDLAREAEAFARQAIAEAKAAVAKLVEIAKDDARRHHAPAPGGEAEYLQQQARSDPELRRLLVELGGAKQAAGSYRAGIRQQRTAPGGPRVVRGRRVS